MADVTIPPPPSTVEEAVRLSNLMAYGFEKHQDIGYWNRYTEDPVYFWKRMLGWQFRGRMVRSCLQKRCRVGRPGYSF